MKVIFTNEAENDLLDIKNYLLKDGESIALAQIAKIRKKADLLGKMPYMGKIVERKNEKTNYKKLVSSPYVVIYEISAESVQIIRVLDGRRNYLKILFD
jgi:plasmid stabilization system protein ParE